MSWEDILKRNIDHALYMVKDSIWGKAFPDLREPSSEGNKGMKSIYEIEEALGRELTLDDFSPAPLNWTWVLGNRKRTGAKSWDRFPEQSELLKERIGGIEGAKKLAQQWLEDYGVSPYNYGPHIKRMAEKIVGV